MIKIGIDFHGVLDSNPLFWVDFARQIKKNEGLVYIITGMSYSYKVEQKLFNFGNGEKWWDGYFSIDDYLLKEKKIVPIIDKKGGRSYPEDDWNRAKSEFCIKVGIDIMFDDSPRYGEYFHTPYFKIGERIENHDLRSLEDKIKELSIEIENIRRENIDLKIKNHDGI